MDYLKQRMEQARGIWGRIRLWFTIGTVGFILLLLAGFLMNGFVNVPEGKALVLIKKTGKDLPDGMIMAPNESYKGIQLKMVLEGWYFFNPYSWDYRIVKKISVPDGKVGVLVRQFGDPLAVGQVIAKEGQKGIVPSVLRPGDYTLNPYAYTLVLAAPVYVPPGHLGIITLMAGEAPKDPNRFLVDPGERGVQSLTLGSGHYYVNPYYQRIVPVDMRAHRFDMSGQNLITFPSHDGFKISMDGTIEWYIDRKRAPEVFVRYVDDRDVITCVVEKIILPNARAYSRLEGSKYLARDYISGVSRQAFQNAFLAGMQKSCASQGIIIKSTLVRNVKPPMSIVTPIRNKEIAIRTREKYRQEMQREIQQKTLSIEKRLQARAKLLKSAEADVSVSVTQAAQEKQVAIIESQKKLLYAKLRLEAAQNEAEIVLAKGRAKSQVIRLNNKANAEGLRNSASAFGSGDAYVRYLLYQKLAPSFKYVLTNTDGPFMQIFKELTK